MDPVSVINKYKGCKLNKSNSKLESYALGLVWGYINNGANLEGAHDSLVEVKAQTDVVTRDYLLHYANVTNSYLTIDKFLQQRSREASR